MNCYIGRCVHDIVLIEPSEETHAQSLKDCMLERLKVTTIPPKGSLTDGQPSKCYSFDEYGLLVNGESDF